mgnify:CR=1 FL=1
MARQPIFNKDQSVYGYELLYRDFSGEHTNSFDGNSATSQVLINSFSTIGIESITQNKKAFINFTKQLLIKEIPTIFDKEIIVIELLENIKVTQQLINVCKKLKESGYILALDDFVFDESYLSLLEIIDIIKVDFLYSNKSQRAKIEKIAKEYNITLLAEKVETREEFMRAQNLEYSYFQGFFFKKPEIFEENEIPVYPNNYLMALEELNKDVPDIEKVAEIIKKDMSLSYKLLKLINSAAFGLRCEVQSIKQALVILGIEEMKKWINLIVIKKISEDEPKEIMRSSLIRAKTAEKLGNKLSEKVNISELFMMGLFSLLDTLMHRGLDTLMEELPISTKVKDAIVGKKGLYRDVLQLIVSYEEGRWNMVDLYCRKLKLGKEFITNSFVSSIKWSEKIIQN